MTDISDLKSQLLSDNPSQANATAADIAKRAQNMKKETSGWEWTVASYVPVYGGDVAKVKELSDVLDELAQADPRQQRTQIKTEENPKRD